MKNKIPALLLAVGMTASSVSARHLTRRTENNASFDLEKEKAHKNRLANTVKRLEKLKVEKEFIKETEEEINKALTIQEPVVSEGETKVEPVVRTYTKVVVKDKMPTNGIDLTDYLRKFRVKAETS